uniref:Mo25 family protein n=1 Tax=Solanum tuberosum TaxID=4113 RepID=M1AYT9_SOLTU
MKDSQIQEFAIWDTRFRNPMGRLQILEDFVAVSILIEFDSINVHAIIRYPKCS